MSMPEITGQLSDGGSYRVTAYALTVLSPDARFTEELDLDRIREVGRDGQAVSLRLQDGTTRIFTSATIDDAGRLHDALRMHVRPIPAPSQPPPPVARQSVEVTGGSGPSMIGVIVGIAVLILVVFLVIIAVRALADDEDSGDPSDVPASEPTLTPTEVQEEVPAEPETNENPTESGRLPVLRLDLGNATSENHIRHDWDDAKAEVKRGGGSA